MPAPRYLTKSRFQLAVECPTKLFYAGKPELYPDRSAEDEFLQALAEGGFQVGELAKLMSPGGVEVKARSHDEQVRQTGICLRGRKSQSLKPPSATDDCSCASTF